MSHVGLVLSGGGARGAYQVGAMRAIAELLRPKTSPFEILTGLSAGAINVAALAAEADDFDDAVRHLTDTWSSLTPEAVYRSDFPSLTGLGMRWLKDLTTGGVLGASRSNYLLDTTPLRELLTRQLDLSVLSKHFQTGVLRGVALSATNYLTGTTVTFFDGAPDLMPWVRHGRLAFREPITVDHVLASAAIPMFFPPVSLDGKPFGDGGVRMTTPVSPAIHLGADKVLAIGIRAHRSNDQALKLNREARAERVSIAQITGVLLNALFLDSLDNDLERVQRINRTLSFIPDEVRRAQPEFLRPIPTLYLRPSKDLGLLAGNQYEKFPATIRHLLRGIGANEKAGSDLLSYVAFQPDYINTLIDLGYQDTMARAGEVETFFADS